jgi:quinol monooxygenase YgiN
MPAYTSGDWKVKSAREQEFLAAWRELATWAAEEHDPDGWGKLLRDKSDPTHFVSVAEWQDEQTIEGWRSTEGFKRRMDALHELTQDMRMLTFELAVEVGRVPLRR